MDKKEILFPHKEIRKTQEKFISDVLNCAERKGKLIAHVPTGIGKTAAVLGPLLSQAIKKNLTVFFVTPRHTQHRLAVDTVKMINTEHNANAVCVDFIGKKWMCPLPRIEKLSSSQFAEYCRDARENGNCEFYNKYRSKNRKIENEIFVEKLKKNGAMHCQELVDACRNTEICPYEAACDVAKDAKIIIADYFHVLSPSIRENFLKKSEKTLAKSIIVFDEAHNLPGRCKELLSSSLSTRVVELAIKEAKKFGHPEIVEGLEEIKEGFFSLGGKLGMGEEEAVMKKEEFSSRIQDYVDRMMQFNLVAEIVIEKKKKSFIGWVSGFMKDWLGQEEGFVRILERVSPAKSGGGGGFRINYLCLDPSLIMKPLVDNAYAIICMSGTMTPTQMYKDLLGFPEDKKDTCEVEYNNPFPKENVLNLVVSGVSTKFTMRSEEMYKRIAERCSGIINEIPGNSFVFFPSYDFRDKVYKNCETTCHKTSFLEIPGMNKKERDSFLNKFKSYKKMGACMFGVSSGSFSEGVDLPGDELKAVIVVGIPLARPDLETKALIQYYDERFGKGWDYGYIFPAIITAIQNAGRCIRSETDRGVIVFMDERYSWQKYLKCFPSDMHIRREEKPEKQIKEFFGRG
jgi:DNA excision repair protein ERCC-2